MKTTPQALAFFARETLYSALTATRTGAYRFIIIATNIATDVTERFIVDLKSEKIERIMTNA